MKVKMKLSKPHPKYAMRFGRHVITMEEQEFGLNESEIKDLKNDGPKHWFAVEQAEAKKRRGRKPRRAE